MPTQKSIHRCCLISLVICSAILSRAQVIVSPVIDRPRVLTNSSPTGSSPTVSLRQLRVPAHQRDQMQKIDALLRKGNLPEAKRRLDAVLLTSPNFADALSARAKINLREDRIIEAFDDAQRSIAADPQFPEGYFSLAGILIHENRYEEALLNAEHCILLAPRSWSCHYERARALAATLKTMAALKEVELAASFGGLKEEPEAIYYLRGSLRLLLHDNVSAARDLESFLKISADGPKAERARVKLRSLTEYEAK
jgi:tetratricopeptide (TPR) repeat protein